MRSKAWSLAAPGFSAPESICPILKAPTQSTPAARSLCPCSFEVLDLLPQFFDLGLDFQRQAGDRQGFVFHAGRLGQHRVRFAMHFLQKKIQLLSQLTCTVQQSFKLLKVAL